MNYVCMDSIGIPVAQKEKDDLRRKLQVIPFFLSRKQLGELRILVEVGLAFLEESPAAFLCFIECVIEHGGVSCKLLDAGLPVEFGIEAGFHHAESERGTFHHRLCPVYAFVFKAVEGNNLVDKSHAFRLDGRVLPAQEPYLTRLLLSDNAGQIRSPETGVERTDLRPGLSEDGIV